MRILTVCLLCLSLCAAEETPGFVSVDLLTLRSVLAGGVSAYESPEAYLQGEKPITHLPDLSIATLIEWLRMPESEQVYAARVSVPQHDRYKTYVVACGDIARKETLLLRAPCALPGEE